MNNYFKAFTDGVARTLDIGATYKARPRRFEYIRRRLKRRPMTDKEARQLDAEAIAKDWSHVNQNKHPQNKETVRRS
jgi:hypothetical protein